MQIQPIEPVYKTVMQARRFGKAQEFNNNQAFEIMKRCEEIHTRIGGMSISNASKERLFKVLAAFTETLIEIKGGGR